MSAQIDLLKNSSFEQGIAALVAAIEAQNTHTHGNKLILDAITAAFTEELKNKLDSLETVEIKIDPQDSTNLIINIGNN